jgi:hypothetical protein
LPNKVPEKTQFYDYILGLDEPCFDPLAKWASEIDIKRSERIGREDDMRIKREQAKQRRDALQASGDTSSSRLINEFNKCFTFEDILLPAGYEQHGNRFRHPNSESGQFSADIKDGRISTFSTKDPLYSEEGAHDVFSAFTVINHRGDLNSALKDAGDRWLKIGAESYNKANQREWAKKNKPSTEFDPQTGEIKYRFRGRPIAVAVQDLVPPVYTIDSVLINGYLYTLTGKNNSGKTTLISAMALSVSQGAPFGHLKTKKGRVLILSGENAYDTNLKFKYLIEEENHSLADIDIFEGSFDMKKNIESYLAEQDPSRSIALVIVDSLQAYFGSGDFNNNSDQLAHTKALRRLSELPGNPAVVVLAHPTKSGDALEPYGGGSAMNEIDTNLTLKLENGIATLHHTKTRQPDFAPIPFKLELVELQHFKNNFDKPTTTTKFLPISDEQAESIYEDTEKIKAKILVHLEGGELTYRELALLVFGDSDLDKFKSQIQRVVKDLRNKNLIESKGTPSLSRKGKEVVKKIKLSNPDLATVVGQKHLI